MANSFKLKIVIILGLFCFSSPGAFATGLAEALEEALNSSVQISAGRKNLDSQREGINSVMAQKRPSFSANLLHSILFL